MMTKRLCVLLVIIMTTLALSLPTMAQNELRQWATSAEATTEFSPAEWSASKATGAPNAMTVCGDSVEAWASLEVTESESLTLYYDTAVQPTQINIHQNYNPGAITSVELIPAEGDFTVPVANSADTSTTCPGVFTIDVQLDLEVIGVVINLDQTIVNDWNEIDAVELVGLTDEDVPAGPGGGSGGGPGSGPGGGPGSGSNNSGADTAQPTAVPETNDVPTSGDDYIAPDGPVGIDVTCPGGREIKNGVKVTVVQMRTGFDYTATAIGMNGFDPIIAVLDENGRAALCNDDERAAANYSADLPTTGYIPPDSTTAQMTFRNNGNGFADVSLVVGSFREGEVGEFLLILEGMGYYSSDGAGDPFAIEVTPSMIASGIDPAIYMISVTNRFDPYISAIDEEGNYYGDEKGNQIWYCDDAGSGSCYGESYNMNGSYVSRTANRTLGGFGFDAMLMLPIESGWEFYTQYFLMQSSGFRTQGDYLIAFHMGIGNPSGGAGDA